MMSVFIIFQKNNVEETKNIFPDRAVSLNAHCFNHIHHLETFFCN